MKVTIDNELIIKAKQLSDIKTNKAIVEKALELFVAIETQKKLKELLGKIALDDIAFQ
jgi:hypothetical protein